MPRELSPMGSYNIIVEASADFTNNDWPYFTLEVDGVAVGGPTQVNSTSPNPVGFSVNLTDDVAHTIEIVSAVPNSPTQLLTVKSIIVQAQTISAQSPLETY